MDRSLVAGPAHFFRLLSCYFSAFFFLPSSNAQRSRGKFPRAQDSVDTEASAKDPG